MAFDSSSIVRAHHLRAYDERYGRLAERVEADIAAAEAATESANTAAESAESVADNLAARGKEVDYLSTYIDSMADTVWETVDGYTSIPDKLINSAGQIVDYTNERNLYHVSNEIAVEYPRYRVKASMAYSNHVLAFYDAGGAFISGVRHPGGTTSVVDEIVEPPENAVTMRVAYVYNGSGTSSVFGFPAMLKAAGKNVSGVSHSSLDASLAEAFEPVIGEVDLSFTDGQYIANNGLIAQYSGYSISDYVPVSEGAELSIDTSYAYSTCAYAFYNGRHELVDLFPKSASGDDAGHHYGIEATVPEGAEYVRIGTVTSRKGITKLRTVQSYRARGHLTWAGKKWAAVGDSLTEVNIRTTMHYHDYITAATGIEVVNMGVSGSGYKKLDGSGKAFHQRIASVPADADVVTIFGSFNDLSSGAELGSPTDTGTTTLCGCINATIDGLFAVMPLARLGIVAPTPWGAIDDPSAAGKYVAALKAICERRGIPFLDLYHTSGLRPWDASFRQLAYSKDDGNSVHPDETGHALIAPRFKAFIDTLIM